MRVARLLGKIAKRRKQGIRNVKKHYWYSEESNVIMQIGTTKQSVTKVFEYHDVFRNAGYVMWIDNLYSRANSNILEIRVGRIDNSVVKNHLKKIIPVADKYGKMKILLELLHVINRV